MIANVRLSRKFWSRDPRRREGFDGRRDRFYALRVAARGPATQGSCFPRFYGTPERRALTLVWQVDAVRQCGRMLRADSVEPIRKARRMDHPQGS